MKKLQLFVVFAFVLALVVPSAVKAAETPSSVIHVVTLAWKDGATETEIKGVLDGLKAAAAKFPGITRLWLKPIKVQGGPMGECAAPKPIQHIIVMEFADEAALKKYAGSEAQKEWYKTYIPMRGESRTHDISN
jgi:hypothetical protein